ncbi:MAG: tyrosine-type recombinase/integrase [Clostridia bacterium]|nr:tyrosine-type recombinase/integrase [Clostridia bacterium]
MPKKQVRSDGRFAIQVYLGKDENGKRKYKTVYGKTQKEAQKKADELRASLGKGIDITKEKDTFEEWAKLFLSSQKNKLSESEYNTKKKRIEYFYSYIGGVPLKSIKVYQVEEALTDLSKRNPATGKPSAHKTIVGYKQVCSQVFKFAIKNRAIEFNPTEFADMPQNAQKSERRALSESERNNIITLSSGHRGKRAAMIAMLAGLRRGEMTALTWNDIDFENNTITVNKSYDFKAKELKLPKTAAGVRVISMPSALSDFLRKESKTSLYVCPSAKNKMQTLDGWNRMLESFLIDLECEFGSSGRKKHCEPKEVVLTIQPFGWHDLRHTYATILFEAGVDVLTAQYLLGHASADTTMKIYTHLSEAQKARSIVKLDEFLKQKSKCKSDASQTG